MKWVFIVIAVHCSFSVSFADCIPRETFVEARNRFKRASDILYSKIGENFSSHSQTHIALAYHQRRLRSEERRLERIEDYLNSNGIDVSTILESPNNANAEEIERYQRHVIRVEWRRREIQRVREQMNGEDSRRDQVVLSISRRLLNPLRRFYLDMRHIYRIRRAIIHFRRIFSSLLSSDEKRIIQSSLSYSYRNLVQSSAQRACRPAQSNATQNSQ